MKKNLFVAVLLAFLSTAVMAANIQKGYVRTKGRLAMDGTTVKGDKVAKVFIKVNNRSMLSNDDGTFTFPIATGKSYMLQEVSKKKYELLDPGILNKEYAYSKNALVIVMENLEEREAEREAYKNKLIQRYTSQIAAREKEIETLKADKKIKEEEYAAMRDSLKKDKKDNEIIAQKVLDYFMKIDYDEKSGSDRQLDYFILNGEIDKADSIIKAKGDIRKRIKDVMRDWQEVVDDCGREHAINLQRHDYETAAYYLKLKLELNPLNVKWMLDVGEFLFTFLSDYEGAKGYFEKGLKTAVSKGEAYSQAEALNDLASLHSLQGENEEALKLMEQALPLMRKARGEECADVANYYGNIGGIYRLLGNREKSLEYNQASLDMYLGLPGTTDTEKTRAYSNVGLATMELGNYEEGEAALLKGLAAGRHLKGKDRGELFLIYNNLGQYYQVMKQLDKAYCMYDSARVEAEDLYGQCHPHTAIAMQNTGTILIAQGNYEKGFDTMLKATDIYLSLVGENNSTVMTCYNNLAVICGYLKRPADQLAYAQKATKIAEALNKSGSIALASPYHTLGSAYWKMEEADSALAYYEKAENITRAAEKGQEELLAHSLNDIGCVYVKKQEYMKAIEYFGEAMTVFATMKGRGGESNMKKIAATVSNTYDIAAKEKMAKKPLRQKVKELKVAYPECFASVK
mgnify:FL=1